MASLECAASAEDSEVPVESSAGDGDLLRIVLLGKTGGGRSSSGNSIMGRKPFHVATSPCSATTQCERQTREVNGRSIAVIDTPGFFNTCLSPQAVTAEVGRCVSLASPGPHAFLLTIQLGRFTQEERDTLQWIKATFGPEATRFTMVLFTRGDQLQGKSIEDFLKESNELSALVDSCQGGYHVFDNSDDCEGQDGSAKCSPQPQVMHLLEKVEKMVAENGGSCYSIEMFQEAERAIREAREAILAARGDMPTWREAEETEDKGTTLERRKRREEEERREIEVARKTEEKLFWCELMTALGKGAAEGAGIMGKDKGKGKVVLKKAKVVQKAAALATSPMTVSSAAKVVSGAVREGSKVLYKHRKSLLH